MAAARTTRTPFADTIQENILRCPLCHNRYRDPKILPCLHTFCEVCLRRRSDDGKVQCPSCWRSFELPGGTTSRLKSNTVISNLMAIADQHGTMSIADQHGSMSIAEKHGSMSIADQHGTMSIADQHGSMSIAEKHGTMSIAVKHGTDEVEVADEDEKAVVSAVDSRSDIYCRVHKDDEYKLTFYCITCHERICSQCTHVTHADHWKTDLQQQAMEIFNAMTEKRKERTQMIDSVKERMDEIKLSLCEEKKKVEETAVEMIKKINDDKRRLLAGLEVEYTAMLDEMQTLLRELEDQRSTMDRMCKDVETFSKRGNLQPPYLNDLSRMLDRDTVTDVAVETKTFNPRTNFADILLGKLASDVDKEFCTVENMTICGNYLLGELVSNVCTTYCTVENVPKQIQDGDSVNLCITIRDLDKNQLMIPCNNIIATLKTPEGNTENVKATYNNDGTYTAMVTTPTSGDYYLDVRVNDASLLGQPAKITSGPSLLREINCKNNINGLGIDIDRYDDIVATAYTCLCVINTDGKCNKTLTVPEVKNFTPIDVAVSADNLYYSLDSANKQVVVTNDKGRVYTCFGKGCLRGPNGIAINPLNGHVYVSDDVWNGAYIRVFTPTGQFITSIPCPSTLTECRNIAFDDTGNLYATDYTGGCIMVFDREYKYSIEAPGCHYPFGINVDVYNNIHMSSSYQYAVFQYNSSLHRYKVSKCLKLEGFSLRGLTSTRLDPRVIAAGDNGKLYILPKYEN